MSEATILATAAELIRAAYTPLYRNRVRDFPTSLRDELSRLAGAVKVGNAPIVNDMKTWLEDGWKLYKAASLGLQSAAERGKMKGPLEDQVFIANKSLCTEVQKAFINTIAPAARELLALGASVPMSKDVRDYLTK